MQLECVNSSWIDGAAYVPATKDLYIGMNGAVYHYTDVPEYEYNGLLRADSAGRYYNEEIKSFYSRGDNLTYQEFTALPELKAQVTVVPVTAPVAPTVSYPLHTRLYGSEGQALLGLLEYMSNTGRISSIVNREAVLMGYMGITLAALNAEKELMVKSQIDAIRGS